MEQKRKFHYAWLILISCCAIQGAGIGILTQAMGIFFVPICAELGFGRGEIALYATIKTMLTALCLPLAAKVLPKCNLRLVATCSLIISILAYAAMSQFNALYQWYLAAIVSGLTGVFLFMLPPFIIGNWFQKNVGLIMGITMAFSGLGGAIMNPVGTVIINTFGWRTACLILAAICFVIVFPFTLFVVRFKPADMGQLPYGAEPKVEEDEEEGITGRQNASQISATAGDQPLLRGVPASIAFRTPAFFIGLIMMCLMGFTSGYVQHLPGYIVSIDMSAIIAGSMMSSLMIGNIVSKLVFGAINDRLGIKKASLIGLGTIMVSFILVIFGTSSVYPLFIGAFGLGMTLTLGSVATPLIVRDIFGSRDYSEIFAIFSMVSTGAYAASVSIVGFMYDAFKGYSQGLWIGVGVTVAAIITVFLTFNASRDLEHI